MPTSHRLQRQKALLLLGICLLLLSVLPVRPAEARTITKSLTDTVSEFADGTFQRSSLTNYKAPAPIADQAGALQLGPIGALKFNPNASAFALPTRLLRAGATVVNDRIFVVGGIDATGKPLASVYSVKIDLENGSLLGPWDTEPSLIAVKHSINSNFVTTVAPVNSAGVTSVTLTDGTSYLYTIGGNVLFSNNDISSFAVRYAQIGSNGKISGNWQELENAKLPSLDETNTAAQVGLQSPAVTTFTNTDTNTTYIYVVGGLQRVLVGTGSQARFVNTGSKSILVARVGAGGRLYRADTSGDTTANEGWKLLKDIIPVKDEDVTNTDARPYIGVWDSMVVADRFPGSTNPKGTDALFLIGGQIAPTTTGGAATYSSKVYTFFIKADGTVEASTTIATLPETRYGHSGVMLSGASGGSSSSFYVTGGLGGGTDAPSVDVLTSYVPNSLELPTFGQGGSNFIKNASGLPEARAFHSTVLVKNNQGKGYIYVIGGRGPGSNTSNAPAATDTVFYSSLNSTDANIAGYPADGWYYSKVFDLNQTAVDVREISWTTALSRTQGLKLDALTDFRTSSDPNCQTLKRSTKEEWKPLDGDLGTSFRSLDGSNSLELSGINARCFQYRVLLTSNATGSDLGTATPSFLNLNVKIVVPGSPDLKVDAVTQLIDTTDKVSTVGVSATIANRNDTAPKASNPTLAADLNGGGSIYVDLFVFEGTTPTTPTLPLDGSLDQFNRGCAQIPTSRMTADSTITINKWYDPIADGSCGLGNTTPITVGVLFPKTDATYTVLVAVDTACPENPTYACIDERDAEGGENNNVKWQTMQIKTVKVVVLPDPEPGPIVYKAILPIISRN